MMPSIEETVALIRRAHAGQTDKSGADYALHPVAVMRRLPSWVVEAVCHAALLHDVLEDTSFTRRELEGMGYDERVLDAVALLTQSKDDSRSYAEKIAGLIATGNRDALLVKFADMSENADPVRLSRLDPETRAKFVEKYTGPLEMLRAAAAS